MRATEQIELAYERVPDMMPATIKLAEGLELPANSAATQTYGFIARKGAGKTYAASKLVEELIGIGAPCIVLDPVGNWYGLRLAADGKKPGLPVYVFGGMHGDLPLDIARGEDVAHVIMTRGISAVVDVSGMRKNERKRFVTAFAERLFIEAKTLRTPRMIVFEEAQVFAPQFARGEEQMLGAVEDIVRLGRNYGLGSTLISQRPQSVNKEVLNQVELLAVGQLSGSHERKAIAEWVKDKAFTDPKMLDQLSGLPVGSMVVWSPQWLDFFDRVRIGKKKTFDASSTPELGVKARAPAELAPVDVAGVQEALASYETGETKGRAGKGGKAAAAAPVATPAPASPAVDKIAQGEIIHLRAQVEQLRAQLADRDERLGQVGRIVEEVERFTGELRGYARERPPTSTRFAAAPEPVYAGKVDQTSTGTLREKLRAAEERGAKLRQIKPTRAEAAKTGMPPGQLALLQVTARFPGTLTKAQIARGAKMTIKGGTFRTYWTGLKTRGYVEASGDNFWRVTDAGLAALGEQRPKVGETLDERVAFWKARLPPGARRLLDLVLAAKKPIPRDELARRAGMEPSGGTFRTYLSTLIANRLVAREFEGVAAHSWLRTGS